MLESFNEQTGSTGNRVKWLEWDLSGWPAGVNLAVDRLNSREILAVWCQIDSIVFLPLEAGKLRFVQFSDGSKWEFEGKVPN